MVTDARKQLVEPRLGFEFVTAALGRERDATAQHALQHGAALRRGLAQQPTPLGQAVLQVLSS